ncbi:hypothetical protein [Streptomyces sp. NPDC000410]|uniref:hypothetical protein n=1 Tax=Streptomyces sp. NPDC000410 TaxID=3154254 RepID=UPI00332AE5AF
MRQRVVRMALVAGVAVLAMLLLLATCGGGGDDAKDDKPDKPGASEKPRTGPVTGLTVPPAYDTAKGWEITNASPDYAVARGNGLVGYVERTGEDRFRLRTVNAATGKPGWSGEPWHALAGPTKVPRLFAVTKGERQFFVTWSHGKADGDKPSGSFVSLDIYDTVDGARQRIEVPWSGPPSVSGTGPGILIGDGGARSAVVDPESGKISIVVPKDLGYPKGCATCRQLTEVRGLTGKGLLVSGAREFWVRGGWFSRNVAPSGADRAHGVPTSLTSGRVLVRWQKAKEPKKTKKTKKTKRATTHDIWAVHDAATGKALVQIDCHKPAIEPGVHPQAVLSPNGRFLVAGNLAFDLVKRTGRCFEEPDGTRPLTLATVTDEGMAYGARNIRNAAEALAGDGIPYEVDLTTWQPEPLSRNARLPGTEVSGVGVFRWLDTRDRLHLIGYVRAD